VELFNAADHDFVETAPLFNEAARRILEGNELTLAPEFEGKGVEILSITGSLFVTKKSACTAKNDTDCICRN
jgi:hypothetical protein